MLTVLETVILTGVILPGSDSAVPAGSESVFLTCRAAARADSDIQVIRRAIHQQSVKPFSDNRYCQ